MTYTQCELKFFFSIWQLLATITAVIYHAHTHTNKHTLDKVQMNVYREVFFSNMVLSFSFSLFLVTLMAKFGRRKVNASLFFTLQISVERRRQGEGGKLWKTVEICKVQCETAASCQRWVVLEACVCPIQLQILPQLAASKCLLSHLNMVYTLQHPTICACNSA